MNNLIDGKALAAEIIQDTKKRVDPSKPPKLVVVLVGDDKPSQTYVQKKAEVAEAMGVAFELIAMSGDSTTQEVIKQMEAVYETATGMIIQLPMPEHIDRDEVLASLDPSIDVDCLTPFNLGLLAQGTPLFVPPTPGAVLEILDSLDVELSGAHVTIIGSGLLVGKPLSLIMMNEGATVTVCNSQTKNVKELCLQSDIIVTGVGKKHILTSDMVPQGAIVIDTGVCFEDGKMCSDVDVPGVAQKAAWVTPTPGGVGPVTVAKLLENVVDAFENEGV